MSNKLKPLVQSRREDSIVVFQEQCLCNDNPRLRQKIARFLCFSCYSYSWEVEQDFLVKMSDFVFITIKRASVTFFPVSPLIRTLVNTDAINQVPLYCFCLGCGLKCLSYPLASFVWYTIKYKFISIYIHHRGFNVDLQSVTKSNKT